MMRSLRSACAARACARGRSSPMKIFPTKAPPALSRRRGDLDGAHEQLEAARLIGEPVARGAAAPCRSAPRRTARTWKASRCRGRARRPGRTLPCGASDTAAAGDRPPGACRSARPSAPRTSPSSPAPRPDRARACPAGGAWTRRSISSSLKTLRAGKPAFLASTVKRSGFLYGFFCRCAITERSAYHPW